MARTALPLSFADGDRELGGEVLVAEVGPSIVAFTTSCAALGLSLAAAYVGHDEADELLVAEALTVGSGAPELLERRVRVDGGTLTYERRRMLYEHVQRVQGLCFEHLGCQLQIRGLDRAARELDPLAAR